MALNWTAKDAAALKALMGDAGKWDARSIWMVLSDFQGFGAGIDITQGLPYAYETGTPAIDILLHRTARADMAMLRSEAQNPQVKRLQIALPSTPQTFIEPATSSPMTEANGQTWMGFIDHGCAFAHPNFRDNQGGLRVQHLWDQSETAAAVGCWTTSTFANYGRELNFGAVSPLLAMHQHGPALYRHIDYAPATHRFAHGTHVMDVAAGRVNPLSRAIATVSAADAASTVPLIFVQLPWKPLKDTSGSAFAVQILDGIRYCLAKTHPNDPLVVNISDGAYAGPHDGSSLVERGIDELVTTYPRLSVVIAAGNAYESKLHGRQQLAPNEPVDFLWKVLPDDMKESYCEVWVPKDAAVEVSVTPPQSAPRITPAGEASCLHDGTQLVGGVIHCASDPASTNRCVLVALAPTRWRTISGGAVRAPAPHGIWTISVKNVGESSITVDAWIERDNPALGDLGPRRQSLFVEAAGTGYINQQETLNCLAYGQETIVVGGYRLVDKTLSRYSSASNSRNPDLAAVSDQSTTLFGLRAAGTSGSSSNRMDGTSVAAPQVARRLVNLIDARGSAFPNASQAKAALEAGATPSMPVPQTPANKFPHGAPSAGTDRAGAGWMPP